MFGLSYNLNPVSTKLCPYSIAWHYVSINSYTQFLTFTRLYPLNLKITSTKVQVIIHHIPCRSWN